MEVTPDSGDSARTSRRNAMLAMAVAGGGFLPLALRRKRKWRPVDQVWPWHDVARWTVRLPRGADLRGAESGEGSLGAQAIDRLPAHPLMTWTAAGIRTTETPREVIRVMREMITQDLSMGRVHIAGGWVLAETEWTLLQLAAALPHMTSDATGP